MTFEFIIFILISLLFILFFIFINRNTKKQTLKKTDNHRVKLTDEQKLQKGLEYEDFVASFYKNKGYKVIHRGRELGKLDKGIDLVAYNSKEILLIQCKNYNIHTGWKITQKDIKAFRMDCLDLIESNPKYRQFQIKAIFIVSDKFIDKGAIVYIKQKQKEGKKLYYKLIPFLS
jgi:Holliday junction resolvase-like predicted endonuclease